MKGIVLLLASMVARGVLGRNGVGDGGQGEDGDQSGWRRKWKCSLPRLRKEKPEKCAIEPYPGDDHLEIPEQRSGSEYERLLQVRDKAAAYRWINHATTSLQSVQTPWIADVGDMVTFEWRNGGSGTFIRFCAASIVDAEWSTIVENEQEYCILITSASCGNILERARRHRLRMASGNSITSESVLAIKYNHPYQEGTTDPNIALLKIKGQCTDRRDRPTLPWVTETAVKGTSGTVAWRVYAYDEYDRDTYVTPGSRINHPIYQYTERATVTSCPGEVEKKVFCAILENKEVPNIHLGGSPFYTDEENRRVLMGIRTGLEGDHFTDIAPFITWMKNAANDPRGWKKLEGYSAIKTDGGMFGRNRRRPMRF